jgi:phage tail-like protein
MDANGLRFWMLANELDWSIGPGCSFDKAKTRLRLGNQTNAQAPTENPAQAQNLVKATPMTTDEFGCRAWWDSTTGHVMATGAMPGAVPIYTPPAGENPTDICMGYDGILYIAVANQLVLVDRRHRWAPQTLTQEGFNFYRIAAHPNGGVWALNDSGASIVRVQGEPLPDVPVTPMAPNAFDYVEPNRNPPRVTATYAAPAGDQAVAIATDPTGRVAVLSWTTGKPADIRRLFDSGHFSPPQVTGALAYPYSFAFLDTQTIAVLATGSTEAIVFDVGDISALPSQPGPMLASGTPYPLTDFVPGPFLHGVSLPPEFPTTTGSSPLFPLSYTAYARSAWAENAKVLDSGQAAATWHRIYLEAAIPSGCAVRVLLAASDKRIDPGDRQNANLAWWEHRFGTQYVWDNAGGTSASIPTGAWVPQASEVPFHTGLLGCSQKGSKGLFTALVQRGGCSIQIPNAGAPSSIRSGSAVRGLRGRYLYIRVQLLGNGRSTPEIAAVRVYASRFSYVAQYLPALYKEWTFGPDADKTGASTRADFLERFIDNFEGVLTVMEDRVASSYLVTLPQTVPADSLDWLASWIGLSIDPIWPKHRRRELIQVSPQLYKLHGTLGGLELALDTATGGLQSTGAVLVLEDYRLRHTFATILGADFGDQPNPLLPDLTHSGNSFVGNTLFLGNPAQEEFLAIYSSVLETPAEQSAVQSFYAKLANRVTILVHEDVAGQDLGIIQRVVDIERPAHVVARIVKASAALLISLASLLGVDTFLTEKAPAQPVRVDVSDIGRLDRVRHLPSLDPRLESGLSSIEFQAPIAKLNAPSSTAQAGTILLDASASQPGPGRTITAYSWTIELSS